MSAHQRCIDEICPGQIGAAQIGATEVFPRQVGPNQIGVRALRRLFDHTRVGPAAENLGERRLRRRKGKGQRDRALLQKPTVATVVRHQRSIPPMQMYLMATKSSMPYLEPSRPIPDCFTPPNGAISLENAPTLTDTMPCSNASATRQTRPMSRL